MPLTTPPPKATADLMSLLYSTQSSTFETVVGAFVDTFPSAVWPDMLTTLRRLLQETAVLSQEQRLVAEYLFYQVAAMDPALLTQFRKSLLCMATNSDADLVERALACQLLLNASSSVAQQTPQQYIAAQSGKSQGLPQHSTASITSRAAAQGSPASSRGQHLPKQQDSAGGAAASSASSQAGSTVSLAQQGQHATQVPNIGISGQDLQGCKPGGSTPASVPTSDVQQLLQQLQAAAQAALLPAQEESLLIALTRDPGILAHVCDVPGLAVGLLQYNPRLAVKVLGLVSQEPVFPSVLALMLLAPLSVRSVEVVAQLAQHAALPMDFLEAFALACLLACNMEKDRVSQQRLTRLVCLFLHQLLLHKSINVGELFVELQAFCMEHLRLREAAALFQLLKAVEQGEAVGFR